ncbi:Transient receptor putative cation channel sub M member 3 [Clonorchis sinensis]|uniref:Transient receptor putative cation channel sub M member 3 n=1 Tax=Clonorchis sinensis TaxID=79923 RepID=A0A8T1MAQ1_CLOSI|nr:Transient receptor putative cation channel sub M member 3 [Clonorchis sinensis]
MTEMTDPVTPGLAQKVRFIEDHFRCFIGAHLPAEKSNKSVRLIIQTDQQKLGSTNSFGYIRFPTSSGQGNLVTEYVRVAHSDKVEDVMSLMGIHWRFKHPRIVRTGIEGDSMQPENLILEDCRKELLKTIPKGSKLRRTPDTTWHVELDKNPRLCIAVLGGMENFVLEESKSETFKKGLISAARTTDGWIITTGLNKGVVRILSEALEDYDTCCLDPHSNRLRCLGIVAWKSVRNRLVLESNTYTSPADYVETMSTDEPNTAYLERHHTHYLFVDDGSLLANVENKAVEFCAALCKALSKPMIKQGWAIPVVAVVLNGGVDVLEAAQKFIRQQLPVFVCAGSGRAADLISLAHSLRLKYTGLTFDTFHQNHLHLLHRKAMEMLQLTSGSSTHGIILMLQEIVRDPSLLTVCDMNALQSLDVEILCAVLSSMSGLTRKQLELSLSWNRSDLAERALFQRGIPVDSDLLSPLMKEAMLEDKADFVKFFLQNGVSMQKFLTLERLHQLYNPWKGTENDDEGDDSECSPYKNDQIFLSTLAKVLNRRLTTFSHKVYALDTPEVHEKLESWNKVATHLFECPFQELFLWALLCQRPNVALFAWGRSQNTVTLALFACMLYQDIIKSLPRYDTDSKQTYKKRIETYESLSVGVLLECHKRDPDLTQLLLESTIPIWGGYNCLILAAVEDRKRFCSTTAYQNSLTFSWTNGIRTSTIFLLLTLMCPLVLLTSDRHIEFISPVRQRIGLRHQNEGDDSTEVKVNRTDEPMSFCKKIKRIYTAPVVKCLLSSIFHVAFLAFFSYTMLFRMIPSHVTTEEAFVMGHFLCFFTDVLRKIVLVSRSSLSLKRYFQLYGWFLLDLFIIVLASLSMLFRIGLSEGFAVAKPLYALTLVFCYTRVFALYGAIPVLGPKIVMIQRMLKELGLFCLIVVVILVAYGVAVQALLYPGRTTFDWTALRDVVHYPYWNLYGELNLDYTLAEKPNCSESSSDPNCPHFNYMAPLFLAFYMLLAGILLINLLIAIFSNVFQDVEQISVQLWKHNRFALVFANKLATVLPVPLSIFEIMTELFCYLCSVHNQIPTASRRSRPDPLRIPMFKEEMPTDPLKTVLSDDELIRRFETACTHSYLQSRQADRSPQMDPNWNYVKNRIDTLRSEFQDFTQMFDWPSQRDASTSTSVKLGGVTSGFPKVMPPRYDTIGGGI